MSQHLPIMDRASEFSAIQAKMFEAIFGTSVDVVIKASGLRLEAIRAIAREQGVEIEDTACKCINESLLAALADAHVRKMRAYFNNARRHIAELNGEELATYIDFCKTFKNRQSSDSAVQTWSDIDTDAIREQFIQKVHQLTSSSCLSIFAGCSFVLDQSIGSLCIESRENLDISEFLHRDRVIKRIVHSHLYYVRPAKTPIVRLDIRSEVRRVTLSARYHIYISEDNHHQQDAIDNRVINRAPAMVA